MKVKILATSNGIMKGGFADHLKSVDGIEVIQNLSIGASHPTVIPFALQSDSADVPDVFLLDMCVNEQRATAKGLYNDGLSELMIDYFLAHCRKIGARPFFLLLPIRLRNQLAMKTVRKWRQYAQRRGVDFLDVGQLALDTGLPLEQLWADKNHTASEFSKTIAEELAKRFRAPPRQALSPVDDQDIRIVPFEFGRRIVRRTSLLTKELAALSEGDVFDIGVAEGRDFEIIGMSLNMARTHGAVELRGEETVTQRLDNALFNPERELWYVSWSMVKPVHSTGGRVRARIVRSQDNDEQVRNDHSRPALPVPDPVECVVELEAFLLRLK